MRYRSIFAAAAAVFMLLCLAGTSALADGWRQQTPYTCPVPGGTEIYKGPGENYRLSSRVKRDGVYTVTEESYDAYGALWGRLKSGAGWIRLTENGHASCSSPYISSSSVPYTVSLSAGTPVSCGPGSRYLQVRPVDRDGMYTVVEEACDENGALWGKLKSGSGWVKLGEGTPPAAPVLPPLSSVPYTRPLAAGTAIFRGPAEAYGLASYVEEDGVYTIVEESYDANGKLWGRLKSGAGWVLLASATADGSETPPYNVALGASVELFNGPGRDYGFCALVDYDAVCTVLEHSLDFEGNLWGRLDMPYPRWINLTELCAAKPYRPMSIGFADRQLLERSAYNFYQGPDSGYAVKIAFRANEELSSLRLAKMLPGSHEAMEILCGFDSLSPSVPFVASVEFGGDLSTFGIYFTDSRGIQRLYLMNLSGRDGSLTVTDLSDKLYTR